MYDNDTIDDLLDEAPNGTVEATLNAYLLTQEAIEAQRRDLSRLIG